MTPLTQTRLPIRDRAHAREIARQLPFGDLFKNGGSVDGFADWLFVKRKTFNGRNPLQQPGCTSTDVGTHPSEETTSMHCAENAPTRRSRTGNELARNSGQNSPRSKPGGPGRLSAPTSRWLSPSSVLAAGTTLQCLPTASHPRSPSLRGCSSGFWSSSRLLAVRTTRWTSMNGCTSRRKTTFDGALTNEARR